MPTYVYTCDHCDSQFEKFQSFKDAPLRTCPHCSNESVRRVFQPVGIVFKGAGWYITDNRSDSSSRRSESTKSEKTSSKDSESSPIETKPTESSSSESKTSDSTSSSSTDT